jgi:CBS domain-containing protein
MSIEFNVGEDTVRSLPLREAISVTPNTILRAAVARMRATRLGCAVVVDMESKPIGIFTERSLLGALLQHVSLDSRVVGDFLDSAFVMIKNCEPISRVWDAIQRERARFICVTDDDGKLVGLTGQKGLAEYVTDFFPGQVVGQRLGCKPWMQHREGA